MFLNTFSRPSLQKSFLISKPYALPAFFSDKNGGAASDARVDYNIARICKYFNQTAQQPDQLLRWMHTGRFSITHPVHAVKNHPAVVVKLRESVPVKQQPVFTVADYTHICLQDLAEKFLRKTRLM
jgi:hypothetical protein